MTPGQAKSVQLNVVWVVSQVLAYNDPNFDIIEFAAAAGVPGYSKGIHSAGLRSMQGRFQRPGTYEFDPQ